MSCAHPERVDGTCTTCGDCAHDIVLNGACFYCGTTELDPVAMSPKQPALLITRESLIRKK